MFDNFNALLTDSFGPLGPMVVILVLGVVLMALTLPTLLKKRADPLDKLRAQRAASVKEEKIAALRQRDAADKLEKYAAFLEPQDAETMSASRLKMMRAGYRSKNAVRLFHFAQLTLGIGMLVLGLIYTFILKAQHGEMPTQTLMLYTIVPGAAGYYLPIYWVQRRMQTRQQEIINGFADSLDLMLVCVEAGQSLDQCPRRFLSRR